MTCSTRAGFFELRALEKGDSSDTARGHSDSARASEPSLRQCMRRPYAYQRGYECIRHLQCYTGLGLRYDRLCVLAVVVIVLVRLHAQQYSSQMVHGYGH
jgi:hypothetical protein